MYNVILFSESALQCRTSATVSKSGHIQDLHNTLWSNRIKTLYFVKYSLLNCDICDFHNSRDVCSWIWDIYWKNCFIVLQYSRHPYKEKKTTFFWLWKQPLRCRNSCSVLGHTHKGTMCVACHFISANTDHLKAPPPHKNNEQRACKSW